MLRLTTFGGIALTRDGLPLEGPASSARRLGVLALLAERGDSGVSTDTLLDLLWPDDDPAAARPRLYQELYTLRQALGDDAIVGTGTVRLNPARITTDVADFDGALQACQHARAVALYRGPFAEGYTARNAPAVERRLDGIRPRYAAAFAGAVEALASGASARGDHADAARWWHRLAGEAPFDARVVIALIDALEACGNVSQALVAADNYEARLREEWGVAPGGAVAERIRRLRTVADRCDADPYRKGGGDGPPNGEGDDWEDDARARLEARIASAVGRRYRAVRRLRDSRIVEAYAALATDRAHSEVEIHVVQPRLAAVVAPRAFVATLGRAIGLAAPQVLPVLEVDAVNDLLYFVTARRPPRSLDRRLNEQGALPIPEALAVARGIAAALAHAHERGVRHGDLRPKRVFLAGEMPVVGGFGLIEAVTAQGSDDARSTVLSFGAPAYQSPEQLAGEVAVDERSDVYTFGCICYEMLAGGPPFARPGRGASLGDKLTQPAPPLRARRETVPAALAELVHACLARVPADRPANGAHVLRALG